MKRLALALFLAGCSVPRPTTSLPDPDGGLDAKEAPMLRRLVEAGKLPPLAERLPEEPLVVTPYEKPGLYGGTWRMFIYDVDLGFYKAIGGYAPLIRWGPDSRSIGPSLAASWEMSSDGRVLTVHLRKGLRWSDGAPLTSADFVYWGGLIRDHRQEIDAPFWARAGGKLMEVEGPDPETVVFRSAAPNWRLPYFFGTNVDWPNQIPQPKHYLEPFDPRVHPELKDFTLFNEKNHFHLHPERPTLWPWVLKERLNAGQRLVFERNPYYWMVDPKGRQLPYIDRIVAEIAPDPEVELIMLLAGQCDAQFRWVHLEDYPLLLREARRGGYRLLRWSDATGGRASVDLNMSPPDPVLKALYADKRFRRALSLAIDRDRINRVCFQGLGRPQQATISKESWHFDSPEGKALYEEWAHAWASHDPEQAGRFLDEMGLAKDGEGWRLRPDGKRLSLLLDLYSNEPEWYDTAAELIGEDFRKIGVDLLTKHWGIAAYGIREENGEDDANFTGVAEMDLFTFPDWVFPVSENYWHAKVGKWYRTGGREGEAPQGVMKPLLELYEKVQAEPDLGKAHQLVHQAIRLHIEEGPFMIGTVGELPDFVLLKNNFKNVPEDPRPLGPFGVVQPAASFPETFYFDNP